MGKVSGGKKSGTHAKKTAYNQRLCGGDARGGMCVCVCGPLMLRKAVGQGKNMAFYVNVNERD